MSGVLPDRGSILEFGRIVVGAPHRAGAERVLGGDVAAGTLRGAPCAVMVAPNETVAGRPATELARRSADLNLLVVGSRAQGPLRRLLLGSTSTRLVRDARCPVLVVPRPVASTDVDEGAQRSTAAR